MRKYVVSVLGCGNLVARAGVGAQVPGRLPATGELGALGALLAAAGVTLVGAGGIVRRRHRRPRD